MQFFSHPVFCSLHLRVRDAQAITLAQEKTGQPPWPSQQQSARRHQLFFMLVKKNSLKLSCNKTKAPYRHEPIYFPCHHFAAYFWPCILGTGVKIGRGFFLCRYINISVCNTLFYIYYHILPELFRSSFFLNCAYNLGSSI